MNTLKILLFGPSVRGILWWFEKECLPFLNYWSPGSDPNRMYCFVGESGALGVAFVVSNTQGRLNIPLYLLLDDSDVELFTLQQSHVSWFTTVIPAVMTMD